MSTRLTPLARRRIFRSLAGGAGIAWYASVMAGVQGDTSVSKLEPVVLDSSSGKGAVIGLQYELSDTLVGGSADAGKGSDTLSVDEIKLSGWRAAYRLRGTLTGRSDDNPKDLQDAQIDASYRYGNTWGVLLGGLAARYEADQKGSGRQSLIGVQGTFAHGGILRNGDSFAFDFRFGQVDPKKDSVRKQILGSTPLANYGRWDAELLYIFPLKFKAVDRVEFNYRYFFEPGAPQAVRDAHLDRHRLLTYRFNLPHDLFVAYSSGKLPFDRSAEKTYELGFSFKLN